MKVAFISICTCAVNRRAKAGTYAIAHLLIVSDV